MTQMNSLIDQPFVPLVQWPVLTKQSHKLLVVVECSRHATSITAPHYLVYHTTSIKAVPIPLAGVYFLQISIH